MGMSSKLQAPVSSDHLELNWTQNMLDTTDIMKQRSSSSSSLQTQQQQPTAEKTTTLNCPRCDSSNTKFCYYNNYNKTQPRHYCKACKRHWTKGGTLRNVPVGGGRKNKRIKRPNTAAAAATVSDRNYLGFNDDQKYIFRPQADNNNNNKGNFLFKPNGTPSTEFDDQVSWDFNGGFGMQQQSSSHDHHQQNLGFSIHSSLTSMADTNNTTTIIPIINPAASSYSPLLSSGRFKDDDSTVTTTATRMMTPNNVISQPWMMQVPSTTTTPSNILEPNTSNFWTWNDIDYMVQGDINKPFEDPHMKL